MNLLRARDVAALDAAAEAAGIATATLMDRAGHAVADAARRLQPNARRVVVLVGPGNNGGDGYVAAAALLRHGLEVSLLEMTETPMTAIARAARTTLLDLAPNLRRAAALDATDPLAHELLDAADLVIDALLGAGRVRPVGTELQALFDRVRASGAPVLAVDVPSGLDADRAHSEGASLKATWTLQLGAVKPASLLPPARERYGAWWVDDLGLAPDLVAAHAVADVVGRTRAGRVLPRRRSDAHKYRAGSVLVVGGSPRFAGAAELAGRAALRGGAGYVTVATPAPHPARWPELVTLTWDDPRATAALIDVHADIAVLGPGLELGDDDLTALLVAFGDRPLLLDGGALRLAPIVATRTAAPRVLTPHAAEAARLLDRPAADVAGDPLEASADLAALTGAWVVLKGPATVIASPLGPRRLVPGGPAALAVAGTGDVLAGVIGAVWAAQQAAQLAAPRAGHDGPGEGERHDLVDLLAAAVVLHAEAARIALQRLALDADAPPGGALVGTHLAALAGTPSGGLIASDVIAALPASRGRIEALMDRA